MDEDSTHGNDTPAPGVEKEVTAAETSKEITETPKRRSSFDLPGLPTATESVRSTKSFSEIEELLKEMHSDDGSNLLNAIPEENETNEEGDAKLNPRSLSPKNDNSIDYESHANESGDEISEQFNCTKEVFRSYNGVRKDNKEELGRGLEFVDRNMINLNFRVSDTEYKISECHIFFSRSKKSGKEQEKESGVMVIKKDNVYCADEQIHKFLQEGLYSYRSKLMKEFHPEREIEYVSVPSPVPSESVKSVTKQPTTAHRSTSPVGKPQLAIELLPKELVKNIQYKPKNTSSSDSELSDNTIPTIQGMKTVPLKIPPSNQIAGHLFVSSNVQSNFLYYHPKDKTLDQILAATNSSPTSLAAALMASDAVSNCSGPSLSEASHLASPIGRTAGAPVFVRKRGDERLTKVKDHICECWCSKVDKPLSEVEEVKEIKSVVSIMVDCDNCGKTYKDGTSHKCYKRKGNRTEQKVLTCEICDRTFSRQAHLSNHMRSHKEYIKSTVKCDLCNKRFHKKGEYAQHKAQYHPETLKEFPCDECGKVFMSAYKLTKHKRLAHYVDSDQEIDVRCVNCNGSYNVTYYKTTHQKECTSACPQNNNSRTNGSVKVTMRKPVAIRSGPLVREDSDASEEYVEEYVLEEYSERKDSEEEGSGRPRNKKKRRFMNLDAPTSDSETEEPPRKAMTIRRSSSDEEPEYIGQEELTLMSEEDDVKNELSEIKDTEMEEKEEMLEEGEVKLENVPDVQEARSKNNILVEEMFGYEMVQ